MKLASKFFIASMGILVSTSAFAAGFTDDKATVVANGTTCKKTTVQFTPAEDATASGKIIVSGGKGKCKKIGFRQRRPPSWTA